MQNQTDTVELVIMFGSFILGIAYLCYITCMREYRYPNRNNDLDEEQAYFRIARALGVRDEIAEKLYLKTQRFDTALWMLINDSDYDIEVIADELVIEVGWEKHIFSKSFKKTWTGKTVEVYHHQTLRNL
jgi:hypothetical protein